VGRRMQVGYETNSSAVVKRPRDTSCLSVVNFNSTILRAQVFLLLVTSASDLPCVQFNSVLLSSA